MIAIFKELTTEDALKEIEAGAEKRTGLYVDMNDAESRKYVKTEASFISGIRKKLDTARIFKTKKSKQDIDAEFKMIDDRLIAANLCYSTLIDEHKAERKAILDQEKAAKQARLDAAQFESDHEIGLILNEKFERDLVDAEKERIAHEERLKEEGAKQARIEAENKAKADTERLKREKQYAIDREIEATAKAKQAIEDAKLLAERTEETRLRDIEYAKQQEIKRQEDELKRIADEKAKREANKKYIHKIKCEILDDLMSADVPEVYARNAVRALFLRKIRHVSVDF